MFDLRFDSNRRPTRGKLIESGPNRGCGESESGGEWVYVSGECDAGRGERMAHAEWAKAMEALGHSVGRCYCEGVLSYYVWKE
jgi:hypothetical protein